MSRVRIPPCPSRATVVAARRLARRAGAGAGGRPPSPSSRRRRSAARAPPCAGSAPATASSPDGRARRARIIRPPDPLEHGEERVGRVRRPAAGREDDVDRVRPRVRARSARLDRRLLVGDVRERGDRRAQRRHLVADAPLEPRPVRRPQRLLHHDADAHRHERCDPDQRPGAAPGHGLPGRDGGRRDDVRRDLDRCHQLPRRDDRPIERGEHLERVDPVEPLDLAHADVEDAGDGRDQVDAALVRSALLEARDRARRPRAGAPPPPRAARPGRRAARSPRARADPRRSRPGRPRSAACPWAAAGPRPPGRA